jgi:GMP synthase (glutamine-hydrolysing)
MTDGAAALSKPHVQHAVHARVARARLLIIDNAVHRLWFKPASHWRARLAHVDAFTLNLPSHPSVPSLDRFTHVLLTGSEASVLHPEPWFEAETRLIRDAMDRGLPILGSCFGHQMLVFALSGAQYLHPSDPPEIGWTAIRMVECDPLFTDLPNPWETFVYHFDEVVDPPAPWIKLGQTQHCTTHVLRYGARPIWGIQAHPEVPVHKAKLFMHAAVAMGKMTPGEALHALRTIPRQSDVADQILDGFLSVPIDEN